MGILPGDTATVERKNIAAIVALGWTCRCLFHWNHGVCEKIFFGRWHHLRWDGGQGGRAAALATSAPAASAAAMHTGAAPTCMGLLWTLDTHWHGKKTHRDP